MLFRKAELSDLKECFGVVEACKERMIQQGIFQWDELYPMIEDVEEDIRLNQLRVGIVDNKIIVIYALNESGEGYEVGNWEYDLPYYVIHRLCVHPDYQGNGIAKKVLRQIVKEALLQGKESLRLDVFSKNPCAMNLYEHFGFQQVGEVEYRKGIFYLMEKKIGLET
ncbi:MAG: GNAT family N-acetyltransferase, partial [Erysipelotrichaceae bacterium]|nr:GNAT family N-acetyltransferase [Erysipelotrichaceae bacterium]